MVHRLGTRIVQGYGLSETTNFSATLPVDLSEDDYRAVMLDCDIPTVGAALYGNEVAVFAGDEPAWPGEVGEIRMRGHNVMAGYAGNPAATEEAFRGGWFRSGDLGYQLPGHPFFVLTGRSKNIAKMRGESVSLAEMERALRALDQVADAVCLSTPHQLDGERITAVVVAADADDAVLLKHLGTIFPPDALPTTVLRTDRIPRTPTGKVLRPELVRLLGLDSS